MKVTESWRLCCGCGSEVKDNGSCGEAEALTVSTDVLSLLLLPYLVLVLGVMELKLLQMLSWTDPS